MQKDANQLANEVISSAVQTALRTIGAMLHAQIIADLELQARGDHIAQLQNQIDSKTGDAQ